MSFWLSLIFPNAGNPAVISHPDQAMNLGSREQSHRMACDGISNMHNNGEDELHWAPPMESYYIQAVWTLNLMVVLCEWLFHLKNTAQPPLRNLMSGVPQPPPHYLISGVPLPCNLISMNHPLHNYFPFLAKLSLRDDPLYCDQD